MGARLTDSIVHGHLWGTAEMRAIFDESARLDGWLRVLVALANAQAEHGIIPPEAATAISDGASIDRLDLDLVASETRRTSHSTLGLINVLRQVLEESGREWVYYGATVQDITDTWTSLEMRQVGAICWRDLRTIEAQLLDLAAEHRDTVMPGRTHGQGGAPTTFGLKVASWADEIRRHLQRLRQAEPRWFVGQLAGAVGSLAFFGDRGLDLRADFCGRLGLRDPGVSWTSSRDRIAEFGSVLSMISGTLGRIGEEIYQLARTEIAELREPATTDVVGSITMPHKRNPELSEHLVTLSRLVRSSASVLMEGMVGDHERDGRSWKAEWIALPECCLLTGKALSLCTELIGGLEVDAAAMRRNLGPYSGSEQMLAALAPGLGKHRAQAAMQLAFAGDRQSADQLEELLSANLGEEELGRLRSPFTGAAPQMVDLIVGRAREARGEEPAEWPMSPGGRP